VPPAHHARPPSGPASPRERSPRARSWRCAASSRHRGHSKSRNCDVSEPSGQILQIEARGDELRRVSLADGVAATSSLRHQLDAGYSDRPWQHCTPIQSNYGSKSTTADPIDTVSNRLSAEGAGRMPASRNHVAQSTAGRTEPDLASSHQRHEQLGNHAGRPTRCGSDTGLQKAQPAVSNTDSPSSRILGSSSVDRGAISVLIGAQRGLPRFGRNRRWRRSVLASLEAPAAQLFRVRALLQGRLEPATNGRSATSLRVQNGASRRPFGISFALASLTTGLDWRCKRRQRNSHVPRTGRPAELDHASLAPLRPRSPRRAVGHGLPITSRKR